MLSSSQPCSVFFNKSISATTKIFSLFTILIHFMAICLLLVWIAGNIWMRENTNQKNFEYGHFSRSVRNKIGMKLGRETKTYRTNMKKVKKYCSEIMAPCYNVILQRQRYLLKLQFIVFYIQPQFILQKLISKFENLKENTFVIF